MQRSWGKQLGTLEEHEAEPGVERAACLCMALVWERALKKQSCRVGGGKVGKVAGLRVQARPGGIDEG